MILTAILASTLIGHSVTLSPIGFTFHGRAVEPGTEKSMPYKLDDEGRWTAHPMFALSYRHEWFQSNAFYFRDSFGKHAGGLTLGPNFPFHKYINAGIIGGLYVRENTEGVAKFPGAYKTKAMEFIPMAAVTLYGAIPVTKTVSVEAGVASNYMVNFFTVGVRYDFP